MQIIKDNPGKATNEKPHVVILLDESASMGDHRSAVVDTFNEYVSSVRDSAETISLYTFNSLSIRCRLDELAPSAVPKLSIAEYEPNAMTPLYDAMATLIHRHGDKSKVQFVTHTDGAENHSKEWKYSSLAQLIEARTEKGWLFVYLGEGLSGQKEMEKFSGLKMNFSPATRSAAMGQVANVTTSYMATGFTDAKLYAKGGTLDIDKGDKVEAP